MLFKELRFLMIVFTALVLQACSSSDEDDALMSPFSSVGIYHVDDTINLSLNNPTFSCLFNISGQYGLEGYELWFREGIGEDLVNNPSLDHFYYDTIANIGGLYHEENFILDLSESLNTGFYGLTIQSYDTTGSYSYPIFHQVYLVNPYVQPQITIHSPIENSVYSAGDSIIINVEVSDPDDNIDKINYSLVNTIYGHEVYERTVSNISGSIYILSDTFLLPSHMQDRSLTVKLNVLDKSGNRSINETVIRVD